METWSDETAIDVAADFGIGARITLAVMADDFATVISSALQATDASGLQIDTDEVSTFVRGDEKRICDYLLDLMTAAAGSGRHVSATVLLSRGCPGEVCRVVEQLPIAAIPALRSTGIRAVAQWALYPLADKPSAGRDPDHMRDIIAVIDDAKARGTFLRSDHFVTTLAGDLADILGTVAAGWLVVGRHVQHVATHLAISINSPTSPEVSASSVAPQDES